MLFDGATLEIDGSYLYLFSEEPVSDVWVISVESERMLFSKMRVSRFVQAVLTDNRLADYIIDQCEQYISVPEKGLP